MQRIDVWCAAACLAAGVSGVAAGQDEAAVSDAELLGELMSVVDEGTEIATQTRMNVDFVPGMVTVLEADMLEGMGARTVLDALALVPGMLASRDPSGSPALLVRGIQFPFNSGNVKVTVNGLSMSREGSGVSTSVLHWPLALVERIEVVRGPGSVLYGEYAVMGLVNVVTRAQGSAVQARVEDSGNVSASGRTRLANARGDAYVALGVGGDFLGEAEVPEGGGDGSDRRQFATLTGGYRDFSFALQNMARDYDPDEGADAHEDQLALRVKQDWSAGSAWSGQVHADFLDTEREEPSGVFAERAWEFDTSVDWSGWSGHRWTAKYNYIEERIGRTSFRTNPMQPPLETNGKRRRGHGIAVQDQYQATEAVTLIGGLRYDVREDIDDSRLTPRLAAIWRIDDRNMLKAQYTEGFRGPTFFELYTSDGQSPLSLESVASTELSYIHRAGGRVGRLTAFHLRLDDMIFRLPEGFRNAAEGEASGVEGEYEQQLSPSLKWLGNVSFVDSYTTRNVDGVERDDLGAARWLGNVGLLWRPYARVLLATHLTYVGERNADDPQIAEEFRLALAATMFDVIAPGLDVRLSLRNAAETDENTIVEFPQRTLIREYDDRIASLDVSYAFR